MLDSEWRPGEGASETVNPEDVRAEMGKRYWASSGKWTESYAERVLEIFDEHLQRMRTSGLGDVIWQSYCTYQMLDSEYGSNTFGPAPNTSAQFLGEDGQFILTDFNHYRNLVKLKKAIIAPERLAFDPQAATNDGEAMQQVRVARHLVNYMIYQRSLGKALRDCLETMLVMGSSYLHTGWNPYLGTTTGATNPVTGNPIYTGDMEWHTLTPFEVVHQQTRQYEHASWHIIRTFQSRYDLASKLLEKGQAAAAQKVLEQAFESADYQYVMPTEHISADGEMIPVYIVYHDRTPAVPKGRMSIITGDALVVYDGDLPFPRAPIARMASSQFLGTGIPFADSWSLLALNDVANSIMSPVISRIDTFGNPLVSVPEGADWSVDDFSGFRMHERQPGTEPPVLVDLYRDQPGIMAAYKEVVGEMSRLAGVDSVSQGRPTENITSGSMAALVQAQSVNFASDDVEQFVGFCEQSVKNALQLYQSMASHEMMLVVAGHDGDPGVEYFKKDAISAIKHVTIQRTNALTNTTAFKLESATQLLQIPGMIKTPQEFLAMAQTGTYETLFVGPERHMALIRQENAMLLRGEVPPVSEVEMFHLHVPEHQALLDMHGKTNPKINAAVTRHIAETMKQWQKLSMESPALLQALGVPMLPPPPQVQMMQQQQGGGPPQQGGPQQSGGPPQQGGQKPQKAPRGVDNAAKADKAPNMPSMPKLPDGSPAKV